MRLVLISDTHGHHRQLALPKGDVLIHAGDICDMGNDNHFWDFLKWLDEQDFRQKIFIGGNHDLVLTRNERLFIEEYLSKNMTYLKDEGFEWEGIRFWGSPVHPIIPGFAFGKYEWEMEKHWAAIPVDTDVLITHGPPAGILDRSSLKLELGCKLLRQKVFEQKPKLHVFGHVHNSYGKMEQNGTIFLNASIMNSKKGPVNAPFVIDLP